MKKIILMLGLLVFEFSFTLDRQIQMPSSEELTTKLSEEFEHFIGKTHIISALAGRKLPIIAVNNEIEVAFDEYFKKYPMMVIPMKMNRGSLLKILLNNDQVAMQELKSHGLIK